MATAYICIAVGVLVTLGLLIFVLGMVIGRLTRNIIIGCVGVGVFGFVMLIGLLAAVHASSVSGPLLVKQAILLTFEVWGALLGGFLAGLMRQQKRDDTLRKLVIGSMIYIIAMIAAQVANVNPVLDVLQQAGVLKSRDDYKPETNKTCPENLKGLYNAFAQYAELNDSLPAGDKWEENTDFTSRVPQDAWLHCPVVSNGHDDKFGYAYNAALGGKKLNLNGKPLNTVLDAAKTPLLYDSTNLSKNAQDAVASLPKTGRHSGRNNILYLDGHVEAVAPK